MRLDDLIAAARRRIDAAIRRANRGLGQRFRRVAEQVLP